MNETISCSTCLVGSCALETLTRNELVNMEAHTYQTTFRRGEVLRKQETPVESLIYLRSGYIKEFISHENTSDQVVQIVKPRFYIGLLGLCTNSASLYSYQSVTDADVCFIDKGTFSKLIAGNGNFAREILVSLSRESIKNHKRFLSLNKTQSFGKVASLLMYLSEEVYESNSFELWLSRAELGQMIASTRESVTRALRYFHNEGIIRMLKNHISIQNQERLTEFAKRG
ncbi:MAG: Crp/Fnr family transcriptional regulator [Bacteroidales bacterium]|nr:Crp/Fnr family transcriptional regulator [Bacteroidales bacterium]